MVNNRKALTGRTFSFNRILERSVKKLHVHSQQGSRLDLMHQNCCNWPEITISSSEVKIDSLFKISKNRLFLNHHFTALNNPLFFSRLLSEHHELRFWFSTQVFHCNYQN